MENVTLVIIIILVVVFMAVGVYYMTADTPKTQTSAAATPLPVFPPIPHTQTQIPAQTPLPPSIPVAAIKMVRFYEGNNGTQSSWKASVGAYSYKEKGGYMNLPFPNDEARSVNIPLGMIVYVTDKDSFQSSKADLLWGPGLHNFKNTAGKISSAAIWNVGTNPPRGVPISIANLSNQLIGQGVIKRQT